MFIVSDPKLVAIMDPFLKSWYGEVLIHCTACPENPLTVETWGVDLGRRLVFKCGCSLFCLTPDRHHLHSLVWYS